MKGLLLLLALWAAFFLAGCSSVPKKEPRPEKGILNLKNWNLRKDGSLSLFGSWEVFAGFDSVNIRELYKKSEQSSFLQIPCNWKECLNKINNSNPIKFIDFRLRIINAPEKAELALLLGNIAPSYMVFLNGKLESSPKRHSGAGFRENTHRNYTIHYTTQNSVNEIILRILPFLFFKRLSIEEINQFFELLIDENNKNVIVSIKDSGRGIPDEIKDRIFEPFFTTKPQGEGSGLGLDIVRKIIEKHKGKIEFESEQGRTEFKVVLSQLLERS